MKKYLSLILSSLLFILISLPNNSFGVVFFLGDEVYVIPNPSGFTAEMLDASPTYYSTAPQDDGGTRQSTYKVSGTGPYFVTVTDEFFNSSGVYQGKETTDVNIVLNADGTLTATVQGEPGSTVISITSKTNTYLEVKGGSDTDSWDETWYFAPPEGWLTSDGTPLGFTAEMLDASPTYYGIVPKDNGGTEQITIEVSGTGPYVWAVTEEDFNASGVSQGQETFDVNVTLNADGTLTVTVPGEPGSTIISLTSKTDTYLNVHGDDGGTDIWDEFWYFAPPAGWLTSDSTPTGFTAEMLNAHPTYYELADDISGEIEQTTIVISGTAPNYVATVTGELFNASGVSQGSETFDVNVTLNADGTLTVTVPGEPGSTIISLTSKTDTYLNVHGDDGGTDIWDEFWYFAPPAGWM